MKSASFMKPKWVKLPWIAAALVTFVGTKTKNIDARGSSSQAITISLPRMSPAMAAFEDSIKIWSAAYSGPRVKSEESTLASGTSGIELVENIMRPKTPNEGGHPSFDLSKIPIGGRIKVQLSEVAESNPYQRAVALKGLTVRQLSLETAAISPAPLPRPEFSVQAAPEYLEAPTLEERTRQLVLQEIQKGPAPSDRPVRYTASGVLVASPTPKKLSQPPMAIATPTSPASSAPPPEPRAGISWVKPDEGSSSPATLSGSVRLAGGLAFTDPKETIVLFREWEGLAVERGQVWVNEGRFEIATGSLKGRLLAQLRDPSGQVLGEGEIRLAPLKSDQSTGRIEDLMMTLRPVFEGARVELVSAHSYSQQVVTVPGAKVWMGGESQPLKTDEQARYFSESGLKKNSSYLAHATAANHWGTIIVGLVGQESRALLFPNKLIDAFVNITVGADRNVASRSGVIWGRVTKNGAPVAGARIEMAADHRQQAHYFNALLIPDRMAEATSDNGTFAFVDVTPGIQSVRVVYQGQAWPAQIVPVEVNHVSYLDFELGNPESVPLDIFDPFDGGTELNGILRWAGDETSEIDIQGRGRLGLPSGPGVVMLEADAGERFELMRYTVSRNSRFLKLPVVRRDWIASLAARKRVNQDSNVGIAVGFDLPDDFTAHVDRPDDGGSTPEIVYFDSRGQAMFTDEGVAGGGFVIYNVSPGLRTITIVSKNDPKLFRQVILTSPDAVNLVLY